MPHDTDDQYPAAKRVAKRDSLLLMTELRDEGGNTIASVRIRNLSATGLMAECDRVLVEGANVRLTLRGTGEIGARISWVGEGRFGLLFNQPVDPISARRPIATNVGPTATGSTRLSRPLR